MRSAPGSFPVGVRGVGTVKKNSQAAAAIVAQRDARENKNDVMPSRHPPFAKHGAGWLIESVSPDFGPSFRAG